MPSACRASSRSSASPSSPALPLRSSASRRLDRALAHASRAARAEAAPGAAGAGPRPLSADRTGRNVLTDALPCDAAPPEVVAFQSSQLGALREEPPLKERINGIFAPD